MKFIMVDSKIVFLFDILCMYVMENTCLYGT